MNSLPPLNFVEPQFWFKIENIDLVLWVQIKDLVIMNSVPSLNFVAPKFGLKIENIVLVL